MVILGVDAETTGLNPKIHGITEIGMVLWDTDLRMPLRVMGYLVNPPDTVEWDPDTVLVNGITKELCQKYGYPDERSVKQYLLWAELADVLCAHNGTKFDRKHLRAWALRYGFDPHDEKLWIDTNTDFPTGPLEHKRSHKLTYMAADHGFLNPFPHRAVFDVMTMLKVLNDYDINEVLEIAKQPTITVQALVSFDDKEKAKDRGYRWRKESKQWLQHIKEGKLETEREACKEAGFKIIVVKDPDEENDG